MGYPCLLRRGRGAFHGAGGEQEKLLSSTTGSQFVPEAETQEGTECARCSVTVRNGRTKNSVWVDAGETRTEEMWTLSPHPPESEDGTSKGHSTGHVPLFSAGGSATCVQCLLLQNTPRPEFTTEIHERRQGRGAEASQTPQLTGRPPHSNAASQRHKQGPASASHAQKSRGAVLPTSHSK